MIISDEVYVNGFFIILIASLVSTLSILYQFKKSSLLNSDDRYFTIYFTLGIIGFTVAWVSTITSSEINLDAHFALSIFCGMLLLLALINRKKRPSIVKAIWGAHLMLTLIVIFLPDRTIKIVLVIIHSVVVYSVIGTLFFYRFKRGKNFGYAIMMIAVLLFIGPIIIQIPSMLNNFNIERIMGTLAILFALGFILISSGYLGVNLIDENKKLETLATEDPLTGLFNRRGLERAMFMTLSSIKRNRHSLSAIALDIDYFKTINDNYGHDCGDIVLKQIAELIKVDSRGIDACCRFGGEEFVIIMPNTQQSEAYQVAERLRALIENHNFNIESHKIRVTSSFGVATQIEEIEIESLLKQADKAMYLAKQRGRNKVEVIEPLVRGF